MMAVRVPLILVLTASAAMVACGDRSPAPPPPSAAPAAISHEQPAPAAADNRPSIVAFGDSLTAGLGLDVTQNFPSLLQQRLDTAGYGYQVVNLGVSGDTTTDGVERLPTVLSLHPAIVILEFGANDGLRGQPVVSSRKNLAAMIETLQKSGARILLAGMTLPRNYGPEYIQSFERMYSELEKQYKIPRIPFLLDRVGGNPELTQPDGLHPTARGTEIVADTVMRYLTPMLAH